MGNWRAGKLNPSHVLYNHDIVDQYKYECFIPSKSSKKKCLLEEIGLEFYDNGDAKLSFTFAKSAVVTEYNEVDRNVLMSAISNYCIDGKLSYSFDTDNVHHVHAKTGHERLLSQLITSLEHYDRSLVTEKIGKILHAALNKRELASKKIREEKLRQAIADCNKRGNLLKQALIADLAALSHRFPIKKKIKKTVISKMLPKRKLKPRKAL